MTANDTTTEAAANAGGQGAAGEFDKATAELQMPCEMTLKQLIMLPHRMNIIAEYHGKEIMLVRDDYEDMAWPVYYTDGSSESLTYNTVVYLRETGYHHIVAMPAAVYRAKSQVAALRAENATLRAELRQEKIEHSAGMDVTEQQLATLEAENTRLQTALASAEARADGLREAEYAPEKPDWIDEMNISMSDEVIERHIKACEDSIKSARMSMESAQRNLARLHYAKRYKQALEAPTTGGSGEAG